LSGKVRLPRS